MIFQSGTSPANFENLQNFKWLSRPAGWTPPKTKYAKSVCIDRGTKRNIDHRRKNWRKQKLGKNHLLGLSATQFPTVGSWKPENCAQKTLGGKNFLGMPGNKKTDDANFLAFFSSIFWVFLVTVSGAPNKLFFQKLLRLMFSFFFVGFLLKIPATPRQLC
jgi:hypothetical protein